MALQTPTSRRQGGTARPSLKKCSGPCGRHLPLSSFGVNAARRDGRRSECKECRRARTGPRGREAQQARALLKELWILRETFGTVPSLGGVLSRAYDEVNQITAPPADFAAKVHLVRTAIFVNGCRTVDDVMDDTNLSRFAVDRAVARLVEEKAVEPRDRFILDADAEEPGRPATEYHPTDSPRGEVFTHILDRSRDDDLL